jgi:hypothetical protein
MLTLDLFSKALAWTTVIGLVYVVWMQRRTGKRKYESVLHAPERHFMLAQVASALLLTAIAVAGFYLFAMLTVLGQRASAPTAASSAQAYVVPDGATVVQVRGLPEQEPANGYGTWRLGAYVFSANAQTTIRVRPGQSIAVCLFKTRDGGWQAMFIVPALDAPSC